ncbi:MAG TPA: proton-conducting transporter membrane subunit [candidate division Zixibacteria bacterium]|nr:proton-conducting transporter membrane subunit [candidate division Zixibacteria bacterium]
MTTAINILILMPILLPFLLALVIFGLRKWITSFSGELGSGIVVINIAIISALIVRIMDSYHKILYGIYDNSQGLEYGAPTGIQFRIDGSTSWLMLSLNILMFFILAYESSKRREQLSSPIYISLLLFLLAGVNCILISYDFFTLFLSWVIICLTLILMLTFSRKGEDLKESGVRSYITFGLSMGFLLFAVVLCYGIFGTLNFDYVSNHKELFTLEIQQSFTLLIYLIIALVVISFGLIAQLFLLNLWMPNTTEKVSTSTKIVISGFTSSLALISLFRVLYGFFNPRNYQGVNYSLILAIIGIITAFEGIILIIHQFTRKESEGISLTKIIIFSAITNIGIIMTTLSFGGIIINENSETVFIENCIGYSYLQIINIGITLFLLFITSEKFSQWRNKSDNLYDLRGIGKTLRITALVFIIGLFSNAGLIPTLGGITIFMLITSLIQAGYFVFGILIAIINIALFVCYLYIIKIILFDKPESGIILGNLGDDISFSTVIGLVLSITLIILGILPSILANGLINGVSAIVP